MCESVCQEIVYHAEEYQVRVSGVILLVSGVIVGVSVRRQKCVTLKSPESECQELHF